MENAIDSAIAEMTQAKDRLLRVFARTPDERLNWSPSPTARTPVQLVAHSAFSLGFIREMFGGKPYPAKTMADADAEHLAREQGITTREEALALFEMNFNRYVSYLETIDVDQLETPVELPFELGAMPLHSVVAVGAGHTRDHAAQLEYLQTIYGDRVW